MHVLWAIIAGLVIGLLAKLLLVRGRRIPLWMTVLLGICGGLVGNAIASGLDVRDTSGIDWIRHILQVASAAVLIGIVAPLWNLGSRRHRIR
ncbi:MAG: GlsB/YeaQ/YmgE family stress response membrane protein [Frankiaceae bacterium]